MGVFSKNSIPTIHKSGIFWIKLKVPRKKFIDGGMRFRWERISLEDDIKKKFITLLLKNIVKNIIYEKLIFSVLICHKRISKTYISLFSVAHFLRKRKKLINLIFSVERVSIFFWKMYKSKIFHSRENRIQGSEKPSPSTSRSQRREKVTIVLGAVKRRLVFLLFLATCEL